MSTTSSIKKQPLIQANQSCPHAKDDPCKYILHILLAPQASQTLLFHSNSPEINPSSTNYLQTPSSFPSSSS
ncbi:hypothetical protein PPACK8108_LOCUS20334 [Phakopsora pachyrhizi]|uniref:Uncharacterized protein n=1 Tax=Phakopsora pachyrhizi TaxID=170000 RepID=A0AAV0BH96_PHAPC|nr:hypothetical protein PPACK8108_LOCUS20334 [Phakopsora pachyrhizi]